MSKPDTLKENTTWKGERNMLYRLIFKDGSKGFWCRDKDLIETDAKYFNATIEKWNRDEDLLKLEKE